jgi:hypothetical protein
MKYLTLIILFVMSCAANPDSSIYKRDSIPMATVPMATVTLEHGGIYDGNTGERQDVDTLKVMLFYTDTTVDHDIHWMYALSIGKAELDTTYDKWGSTSSIGFEHNYYMGMDRKWLSNNIIILPKGEERLWDELKLNTVKFKKER